MQAPQSLTSDPDGEKAVALPRRCIFKVFVLMRERTSWTPFVCQMDKCFAFGRTDAIPRSGENKPCAFQRQQILWAAEF